MAGRKLRPDDDEKAEQRAVVAAKRERNRHAVEAQLCAGGHDRLAPRFGLAHEPARQCCRSRPGGATGRLDGAAEAILVPGDTADPFVPPETRHRLGEAQEDTLAIVAGAQCTLHRCSRTLGANPHDRSERQTENGDSPAGLREPRLIEAETGEREDDPAECEQLRALFELGRTRDAEDRKSTRLNSSHVANSYAVFFLKK